MEALDRAKAFVRKAEGDLATAVADVAKAREALTEGMVAAAKNGSSAPSDGTLVAARRRQDQARDVLDAARSAVAAVAAQRSADQATQCAEELQAAAAEVLRPLIEPTINAALRAHQDWICARDQLHFLYTQIFTGVADTTESLRLLEVANGDTFSEVRPEVKETWARGFEALKRDASAALPWEA